MLVQPRTLEAMQNYPTSYELGISIDGQFTRFAFSQKKTERAILATMGKAMNDDLENAATAAMTEDELNASYTYDRALGRIILGKKVWVGATGKTERECRSDIELGRVA